MVNSVQTSIKRSLSPEVTVLDVEQKSSPQAKKPRLSAVGEGEERDKVKSGPAMARAAAIAAAVGTGSSSGKAATAVATSRKPATASAPVKKTIFMPVGPKPTEPTIPASLRANLSIPVASTSSPSSDTATLKKDFIDALPEDMKELLKMEIETMGDDWFVALRGEFVKPYFKELKTFVVKEQNTKKIFPPAEDVYSWTRLCPLSAIRVVVIGQDPYHDDGQAHGLAFSVRKGVRTPPSLRNIYKEIGEEISDFKPPAHGHLTSWARQGVLLLNTCLTVRAHEAASHSKKGWETFTTAVLKTIVDRLAPTGAEQGAKGVVFLAWGKPAERLCAGISERSHHVLKSAHPSPLAASRGFFGNGHFVKCNEWLEGKYGTGQGIDWTSVMRD
ncbi:uracil DNA glycosylase [Naganishia albida]|nr:uracil DNA glycosylase [Naganishia albida]